MYRQLRFGQPAVDNALRGHSTNRVREIMAVDEIECQVCGVRAIPETTKRCRSCGARLSEVVAELTEEELYARRNQPDGFEVRWVFIAFGLFLVMAALALALLPLVIPMYDPQGFAGIVITIVLWFLGAAAINYVSAGKNFLEPPVGGLLAADSHDGLPLEHCGRLPTIPRRLCARDIDGDDDGVDGGLRWQSASWRSTKASAPKEAVGSAQGRLAAHRRRRIPKPGIKTKPPRSSDAPAWSMNQCS